VRYHGRLVFIGALKMQFVCISSISAEYLRNLNF